MDAVEKINDFTQVFFVATVTAMPPSGPADKPITTHDVKAWSEYVFIGDIIEVRSSCPALYLPTLILQSSFSLKMLIMMLNLTSTSVEPSQAPTAKSHLLPCDPLNTVTCSTNHTNSLLIFSSPIQRGGAPKILSQPSVPVSLLEGPSTKSSATMTYPFPLSTLMSPTLHTSPITSNLLQALDPLNPLMVHVLTLDSTTKLNNLLPQTLASIHYKTTL